MKLTSETPPTPKRFSKIHVISFALAIAVSLLACLSITAHHSNPVKSTASVSPPYNDLGPLTSEINLGNGVTLSPPPAGTSADFTASPSTVYQAFEAGSVAAPIASEEGYGTADMYQASFTDLQMGVVNNMTGAVTPDFDGTLAWVMLYTNVDWLSRTGPPASKSASTSTTLLRNDENVLAVFDPASGALLDTQVLPVQ